MIKQKIISFFLCLVFAIQVLPIAQIGGMLSQNQWTEELPHNDVDDSAKSPDVNSHNHPYLPPCGYSAVSSSSSESKALAYIHFSERIPSNHSTEVVIPPPDSVII
jgi:hypothetical protein